MKKWLILCIGIVFPVFSYAIDTNKVCFENIESVSYKFSSESYITGAENGEFSIDKSNDANCLEVKTNRKSDIKVNTWLDNKGLFEPLSWYKWTAAYDIKYFPESSQSNFAFMLDSITFTVGGGVQITCPNIYLSQFNDGLNNVWEIYVSRSEDKRCTSLVSTSGIFIDFQSGSANNKFTLGGIGRNDEIYDNVLNIKGVTLTRISPNYSYVIWPLLYVGTYLESQTNNIHVVAQRYSNSYTASDVKALLNDYAIDWSADNMVGTRVDKTDRATELSFAVKADLEFDHFGISYLCKDITFGQWNKGSKSPWWIFSNNNNKNKTITCSYKNQYNELVTTNFYISAVNDSSNQFELN